MHYLIKPKPHWPTRKLGGGSTLNDRGPQKGQPLNHMCMCDLDHMP